jgi:hypothetical protein
VTTGAGMPTRFYGALERSRRDDYPVIASVAMAKKKKKKLGADAVDCRR